MLGMHGSLANSIKTQECDVLIAVGMRFDDRITGKLSTYARQAKKIHFEIDPSEVNQECTGRCSRVRKLQTDVGSGARTGETQSAYGMD